MANTFTNIVTVNGVEMVEVVEDRTKHIAIRTPKDETKWRAVANRERIVTRAGEAATEALSPEVPEFVPTVVFDAAAIAADPELQVIAQSLADKIDAQVGNGE